MKQMIRNLTPEFILQIYHWCLATIGAFAYQHPSKKMVVIGVTGTKGKSTVVNLIERVLTASGKKVGLISTFNFKIGDREWQNETKQTMPGRFKLQQLLAEMVKADCQYAVIETSSEGIAQYRHLGIEYDLAVFTNLSPEHIESHGSYNKYRQAKMKLFSSLADSPRKVINGHEKKKIIVANHDDPEVEYFLHYSADMKFTFGLKQPENSINSDKQLIAEDIEIKADGTSFKFENYEFNLKILGEFNIYNAMAVIAVGTSLGIELQVIKEALEQVSLIPGRMEEIKNNKGIRIFIDYAHEPSSLEAVYKTVAATSPKKIISVLGSQGGGRDKAKRSQLGELAASYTDHVIITNEDPYDEDPQKIIDDVAKGATHAHSRPPIEKIINRKDAIKKALSIAESGDVVIITGKGSETVMAVAGGQKVPWDDRQVVRELLN